MTTRLAYLVTHPIQYQAPLLRRVAAEPGIELTAFFGSDFSMKGHVDPGFGRRIEWDVPLTEGYAHAFLPTVRPLRPGEDPSFARPFNRLPDLRGFDALWVHGYHRAFHWLAITAAKAKGLKVLVRDETTAISAHRSAAKERLKRLFFAGFDRLVDGWLAIGRLNRDYWLALGADPGKVFAVPYAVDNAFFRARIAAARPQREALRARLGLQPGRPVVLFAAKLIERKRPFDLLRAFNRLERPAHLLFVGDGELRAALEAEADARSLFLGFQGQAELAALYGLADLFVLPSEREAWGLVVNEAMNGGCAVIASDRIGAAADLVRPGENGFVYPVGDIDALARALMQALSDDGRLAAMGAASERIVHGWSFEEDVAGLKQALAYSRTAA